MTTRSRFRRSTSTRRALAKRYGGARRNRCDNCGKVCAGPVCSTACGGKSAAKNVAVAAIATTAVVGGLTLIARAIGGRKP